MVGPLECCMLDVTSLLSPTAAPASPLSPVAVAGAVGVSGKGPQAFGELFDDQTAGAAAIAPVSPASPGGAQVPGVVTPTADVAIPLAAFLGSAALQPGTGTNDRQTLADDGNAVPFDPALTLLHANPQWATALVAAPKPPRAPGTTPARATPDRLMASTMLTTTLRKSMSVPSGVSHAAPTSDDPVASDASDAAASDTPAPPADGPIALIAATPVLPGNTPLAPPVPVAVAAAVAVAAKAPEGAPPPIGIAANDAPAAITSTAMQPARLDDTAAATHPVTQLLTGQAPRETEPTPFATTDRPPATTPSPAQATLLAAPAEFSATLLGTGEPSPNAAIPVDAVATTLPTLRTVATARTTPPVMTVSGTPLPGQIFAARTILPTGVAPVTAPLAPNGSAATAQPSQPAATPIPVNGVPAPTVAAATIANPSPTTTNAPAASDAPPEPQTQRTEIAARPDRSATQPITVSTTPQPAGQVFAAAIATAATWRDRSVPDRIKPLVPSPIAPTLTAIDPTAAAIVVQPTTDAQRAPLDLTQDPGVQRMIDHIETLRDGADARDSRIRLIPDALGSVDVAVRQEGDRIHVSFSTQHDATRALIADAQPRLTELAAERGVRIAGTSVTTDPNVTAFSAMQPSQTQAQSQQQQQSQSRPHAAPQPPRAPGRALRDPETPEDQRLA